MKAKVRLAQSRTLALLGAFAALEASCGTLTDRLDLWPDSPPTQVFGWPLFEAVHEDWRWITGNARGGCKGEALRPFLMPFYFLSVPVDIAADVVFAPIDIVAGLFGCSRAIDDGNRTAPPQPATNRSSAQKRYDGPNNGMCVIVDTVDMPFSVTTQVRLLTDAGETVLLPWGDGFVEQVVWTSAKSLRISGVWAGEHGATAQVPGLEIQYDLRGARLPK